MLMRGTGHGRPGVRFHRSAGKRVRGEETDTRQLTLPVRRPAWERGGMRGMCGMDCSFSHRLISSQTNSSSAAGTATESACVV